MQIVRGAPSDWRADLEKNDHRAEMGRFALAMGNFDGVHRGHRALIGEAVAQARSKGLRSAVLTFEPHPRSVFQPDIEPFRLSPEPLKTRRIMDLGVDALFVATFDKTLFSLSAEAFARDVLGEAIGAACVVTGADFRFGAGRTGDVAALKAFGAQYGFEALAIDPVGEGATPFSSTAARDALKRGRPEDAARILGDWHRIEGVVEKGDQRGRDLGFPTANLSFGDAIRPAFGVYAVSVEVRDGPHAGAYDGVASIGIRPTFNATIENFEVYIFNFSGDLYGTSISAELRRYLRAELKFDDVDALISQMRIDADDARAALAQSTPPWL